MARTIRRCPCAAPGDCKGDTHLNQDRKAAARKARRRDDRETTADRA